MSKVGFGFWNWVVLIAYLLVMLGIGAYFTKRASESTDSFFKANGKIPAWAAGFSIWATTLSAITFMSTPEQAFLNDWGYTFGTFGIFLLIPVLIKWYVPFFRKLKVTTAYEYLEHRFGPVMRALGSALFMLYHIGRVAIVIYLPILAITSVSNINPVLVAVLVGLLCIIYAFLGGIEGVIWTDVIQGFLLLGSAILICGLAIFYTGGFGNVFHIALGAHKFYSAADWNPNDLAKWIPLIFIGSWFNNMYQYTASQDVVQRYQTTPSMKATAKSLWTNGWLALSTIPLFFGMGTLLYCFYHSAGSLPHGFNTSALVPYFVITKIPAGLAGLIIAGIFAAAQSTIASSLNAISSCFVTDFKQRFFDKKWKINDVKLARIVILVAGAISLSIAIYLLLGNASQTWNLFLTVTGLFGVPVAGIFAAGIFTKSANRFSVIIGVIASAALTYWMQLGSPSPFLTSTVSFVSSFLVAWLVGLITPKFGHDVTGLTVKTINEKVDTSKNK
ncbi:Na+/proline symporter [Lactobacillus crispatus]|uniref:Na+/proline symporter n=1 Tax=Lactobacillus crispatus TaxID=47770 RepID=A0A2N5L0P0_9LACO|nr:sodium:solute symporter [Lactobacillus crispatus]PLT12058.1 Na+/proline symporter [Lactobacillus crispatus]